MFDPKPIMEKRKLQEPVPTSDPAAFPRSEEVPEGCIVLEDLKDEWGCQVDFHTDVVYAQREPEDWYVDPVSCTLKMHILEPIVHAGVPEEEKNYQRKKRPRLFSSYMEEEICWCLLTRAVSFIIICGNWGKR